MKTIIAFLVISIFALSPSDSFGQKKKKTPSFTSEQLEVIRQLDNALTTKHFAFYATQVMTNIPTKPYEDITNDGYTISVDGDKIWTETNRISSSFFNPFELNTTIKKYEVSGSTADKKGMMVNIQALNVNLRLCTLTFYVFDDGTATLLYGGVKRLQFRGEIQLF